MAFLAKKVPKIFPSKTKKGNDDLLPSRHSYNKGKGSSLFRKVAREGETGPETQHRTPVTEKKTHKVLLATGEAFDCCEESNNNNNNNMQNICSDAHSDASTLESSPTPVPRETMDPTMLVLPDLPTLEFPCPNGIHESNNNKATPRPSSLRLAPRPIAHDDSNEFPAPPVALISVPMEFQFPPPPTSSRVVVASCLTHPPPRVGEWDDATIESQELLDDDKEAETDESHLESSSLSLQQQQQQQQQQQRETATTQAIMKPWIERAARLALLQNRACGNYRETEGPHQQRLLADEGFAPLIRQRRREAALLNLRQEEGYNPRALLASLEKGQRDTTTAAAPKPVMDSSKLHSEQSPTHTPRIVRWHVVRQPCK
eukprot:CAMPEP_0116081616 /NCGR_PEP_ID=MMETSP0327-20121206/2293_1 /TAXON_ID=44447 /ORGANISM="Pseudo-nitzschia delicatissima, Strain B596" /LENGTH=372 /DNA_ID=CAMNT_0003572365 /DNA_START=587 /DNA_END=1705 /DNA_ORIENTATION=-